MQYDGIQYSSKPRIDENIKNIPASAYCGDGVIHHCAGGGESGPQTAGFQHCGVVSGISGNLIISPYPRFKRATPSDTQLGISGFGSVDFLSGAHSGRRVCRTQWSKFAPVVDDFEGRHHHPEKC